MSPEAGRAGNSLSLRDEQKRLTRRRLVDGAVSSFGRKGYAATTIEDIVAEANASRATFYLHFKSKADVVLVLSQGLGRNWRELFLELTSGGRLSRGRLRAWLDGMAENYLMNRVALDAIQRAAAIEPEVAEAYLANVQESIDVMTASIQRWYGGPEQDARVRAGLLLTQMDRFFHLWAVQGMPFERERVVAAMTDQWLSALRASARAGSSAAR
jgi:AcrR family transcriptional regulator